MECSGLQSFHKYLNDASEIVLSRLLILQFEFDFIFINTSHQFDQTIVECYYFEVPKGNRSLEFEK